MPKNFGLIRSQCSDCDRVTVTSSTQMVTEAMSEAPVVTTKRVIAESVSADDRAILWYVHESAFMAGTFSVSRFVDPSPSLTRIADEVVARFDFIQNSRCV